MDRLFRRREAAKKAAPPPVPADADQRIPPSTLPDDYKAQ
jgi:hypothetical protein